MNEEEVPCSLGSKPGLFYFEKPLNMLEVSDQIGYNE
jgi:hypothetical protein